MSNNWFIVSVVVLVIATILTILLKKFGEKKLAWITLWIAIISLGFTILGFFKTSPSVKDNAIDSVSVQELNEDFPITANDFFKKGHIAKDEGNYDKAILYYKKSIELKPTPDSYNSMGVCYRNKGEYDKAIQCYQKAIELNPNFVRTYNNMGIAYYHKNKYDKAIQCYKKAINLNPKSAVAYNNMGIAYNFKNEYDEAIQCYQKAIELKPDYANAYSNMGVASINKAEENFKIAAQYGDSDAKKWLEKIGNK